MRTIFLNFACILTLFNVEGPLDEKLEAKFSGESIIRCVIIFQPVFPDIPRRMQLTRVSRHPIPFKCKITPRSGGLTLIRSVCAET